MARDQATSAVSEHDRTRTVAAGGRIDLGLRAVADALRRPVHCLWRFDTIGQRNAVDLNVARWIRAMSARATTHRLIEAARLVHRDTASCAKRRAGTDRDQIPDCDIELTHAFRDRRTTPAWESRLTRRPAAMPGRPAGCFGLASRRDPAASTLMTEIAPEQSSPAAARLGAVCSFCCKGHAAPRRRHLRWARSTRSVRPREAW